MCSWYLEKGPANDVVISSRVRLARNFNKYPFPGRMNGDQANKIADGVKDAGLNGSSYMAEQFHYINMSDLNDIDRVALLEKHLVSLDLIKSSRQSGVLISNDENISIMVNEEDHIRIQSILPGLQLDKAWELSDKIDSLLEEKIEYAYDRNIGYLTSCPTNVGTGMRASVMLHLPALNMLRYINGLLSTIGKFGIAVRGIYGEGSETLGSIYQISNQITLGQSEEEIVGSLKGVINQIVEQERMARNKLNNDNSLDLEDKIFRAYGALENARLLPSDECLGLLSLIKLGIDLGLINNISREEVNEFLVMSQPACLQKNEGRTLNEKERDAKRAELIRKKLKRKGN